MDEQVETVLANWIEQALSPVGKLPSEMRPARWVAINFLHWWRTDIEARLDETLSEAESALTAVRNDLKSRGGWDEFGESLHELIHLADALSTLRQALLPESERRSEDTDTA